MAMPVAIAAISAGIPRRAACRRRVLVVISPDGLAATICSASHRSSRWRSRAVCQRSSGSFGQADSYESIERGRAPRDETREGRWLSFEDGRHHAGVALRLERLLRREHFEQQGAKCEDVRTTVDLLPGDLFRRHVLNRSDDQT